MSWRKRSKQRCRHRAARRQSRPGDARRSGQINFRPPDSSKWNGFPGLREGCENDYERFGQFGRRVVFRCDNEPSILALLRAVKLAWQCNSTRNVCRGRPAVQRRCRKFGKNVIKDMSDRSNLRSSPPSVLKCRQIMTY